MIMASVFMRSTNAFRRCEKALAATAAIGGKRIRERRVTMRILLLAMSLIWAPAAAAETPPEMVVSAWASGDSASACDVKPITLFMSDGVVAVFLSKDGALHSLGTWSVNDDTLTMTHNDFPLSGSGQSKEPVNLTILELSETRFITQNADSVERKRVRCPDIEITLGHDHDGHGNH
mgnify:CR=1 FL=1